MQESSPLLLRIKQKFRPRSWKKISGEGFPTNPDFTALGVMSRLSEAEGGEGEDRS